MRYLFFGILLALALPSSGARGEPQATKTSVRAAAHTVLAYAKVGGLIPFATLGPNVSVRLGGGYVPPFWGERLGFVIDLGYSRTTTDGSVTDARLGAGPDPLTYSYALAQHDLNLFFGPQLNILPKSRIMPYLAIGLDLHFLRTEVSGAAAAAGFGDNDEQSTKAGFALRAGAGWRLGPGWLTGLSFAWAPSITRRPVMAISRASPFSSATRWPSASAASGRDDACPQKWLWG